MSPHSFDQVYHFSVAFFEISEAERREVYAEIRDSYQMRPSYLIMLVLACLVAILGLLANSPAVVIGAMLISPLMSPFLSAGLALAIGDWELGKAAMRTILVSVLAAIFISALAVAVSPLKEPTAEIVARTNPNLLDLGIAFFSGCAGTYTLVSRKGTTTIPGVAIATAVMPPLCVVGFGVYYLDPRIIFGALSLFVTNLAAIIISAAFLFYLASFRISEFKDEKPHWSISTRLTISFVVLGLLAIPLASALVNAAETLRLRKKVEAALTEYLKHEEARARLVGGWSVMRIKDRGLVVEATVRTLSYFTKSEIDAWTRTLEQTLGEPVDLQLDQIQVRKGGLEPAVTFKPPEPVVLPVTDPTYFSRLMNEYKPVVEFTVKTIDAELDQFLLVTDHQGVIRIEIRARVDRVPSEDICATSIRGAFAQLEALHLPRQPQPEINFYFLPKQAEKLPVFLKAGKFTLRPEPIKLIADRLKGFRSQVSPPGLQIKFDQSLQLDESIKTDLQRQIMKALAVSQTSDEPSGDKIQSLGQSSQIEILVFASDETNF
ncbi:MAG TPA: DUF389 domain-containing protein [Acidobacteriota bacterium]|nr:DUF389 domain-containing protein [Acidobacteriota bacterium]HND18454.1 DUF389 domain-containing protein [Acidobacteriota bacterium]HNH81352.1 DUF389 domain-containing protein [Acidobacteriota bacterium]HNJ42196.1 DUF389 domain-containing protein [Acidobacteriota bacterium]